MSDDIKKKVRKFIKTERLTTVNNQSLSSAASRLGYTIVYYSRGVNATDVETLISEFHLEGLVKTSNGFLYTSGDYRLIFLNSDLSNDEKTIVLSHEIGHIVCKHLHSDQGIGFDVREEYEANEFSHYLLNPTSLQKIGQTASNHKKTLIAIMLVLTLLIGGIVTSSVVKKHNSYYGEYYITPTGTKYHKKDCVFVKNKNNVRRLTKEEFESGDYTPCEMCLPEE